MATMTTPHVDSTRLRADLSTALSDVRRDIAGLSAPIEQMRAGGNDANEDMDGAQASVEHEALISRRSRLRLRERELVDALARMERGEAPECLDCGELIPAARLRAIPTAVRCRDCAAEFEQHGRAIVRRLDEEDGPEPEPEDATIQPMSDEELRGLAMEAEG